MREDKGWTIKGTFERLVTYRVEVFVPATDGVTTLSEAMRKAEEFAVTNESVVDTETAWDESFEVTEHGGCDECGE